MKKNKCLIFLILLLFCTGCEANYRIEIKNGNIIEYGNAIFSSEQIDNNIETTINNLSSKYFLNDDLITNPKTNILQKNNKSIYQIINNYNYDEYKYSTLLSLCYDNVNITNFNKTINIKTSDVFNCFDNFEELDKVTIEVYTMQKVISNNADKKIGNTYYWYINKDNINRNIQFSFSKNSKSYMFNISSSYYLIILFSIVLVIAFGVYYFIVKRNKKNNKI